MKIKPGILIAVIALIIVVAIVVIVTYKGPNATPPANQQEPLTNVEISQAMGGVSGTITAISGNIITLDALILLQDPSQAPIRHTVNIKTNENSEITKTVLPTTEEIIRTNGTVQPAKTQISLSDLKVGDKIDVTAPDFIAEELKNGNPIEAVKINLLVSAQ